MNPDKAFFWIMIALISPLAILLTGVAIDIALRGTC